MLLELDSKPAIRHKTRMSEQRLLFEPQRPPWVDRLWQEIPTETRHQLISILAEMGRNDLKRRQEVLRGEEPRKEKRDES